MFLPVIVMREVRRRRRPRNPFFFRVAASFLPRTLTLLAWLCAVDGVFGSRHTLRYDGDVNIGEKRETVTKG